jgi:hypothetical protein
MDTSTAWMLFVMTAFIHAATFMFLQEVANYFNRYISATGGLNHDDAYPSIPLEQEENLFDVQIVDPQIRMPPPTHVDEMQYQFMPSMQTTGRKSQDESRYTPLHDILDISIFR